VMMQGQKGQGKNQKQGQKQGQKSQKARTKLHKNSLTKRNDYDKILSVCRTARYKSAYLPGFL